jgi:hypothetical protein
MPRRISPPQILRGVQRRPCIVPCHPCVAFGITCPVFGFRELRFGPLGRRLSIRSALLGGS